MRLLICGGRDFNDRNQAMLDLLQPDAVLAFPGGNGTADMVRRAEKAGLPTTVIQKDHWQDDEL